jgi:rod shape-determining protein MreC
VSFLLNFFSRFRESLTLLAYLIISFLMIISSDVQIVEGLRSTTIFSVGVIGDITESISSYFNLREVNQQLREENVNLAYENFQLQDALLENIRLRKLIQFKYKTQYDLLPAKVIGFSPIDIVTGVLLSSEDIDQVSKNSAVMTADGLAGKIVKLSGKYAICQILLDPNCRVSVRVQRNRELGMTAWDGGNGLLLEYIPNTVEIRPGDVLFTSGFSQIYPPNIKVGTVLQAEVNSEQLFQTIKVKPAVNFNKLEEVYVLKPEQQE